MCSAASFTRAESAESAAALVAALSDVVENSLFGVTMAATRDDFECAVAASDVTGWLISSVAFAGSVRGRLQLACPIGLARQLCAAYTGAAVPGEVGEADVIDFSGELANLTCGAWLTRACGDQAFRIMEPTVACAPARESVVGGPVEFDRWRFFVEINDTAVRLDVEWGLRESEPGEGADAR